MFRRAKKLKRGIPGHRVGVDRRRRLLRIESLESRRMLSGVVNVFTQTVSGGPTVTAGDLWIQGDTSQHHILVNSTPNGGLDQFTITSTDGTLFRLNTTGGTPTLTSVAVDGIFGSFNVNLGHGGANTFDIEAPTTAAGSVSTVVGNVNITNASVETNKIDNVVIQGNLNITKAANTFAYSEPRHAGYHGRWPRHGK